MSVHYPVLIASAILFAGVVIKLHDKDTMGALFISLAAIPTVLLIGHLADNNMQIFAYLLIILPIILLYYGYAAGVKTPLYDSESFNNQPFVPDRMEPENA